MTYDMLSIGNWGTAVLSALAFMVLLCRINELSWRTHRPLVVTYNLTLAIACIWAGWRAWDGRAELGDLCIAIAALCWIGISYPSWRNGPPHHTESDAMPLDPLDKAR